MKNKECYQGLETGPIRPPSEAGSLMLRVTRNCPWNQCKFCGLYKGKKFSIRPVDHVKQDIDMLRKHVDRIKIFMERQDVVTSNLRAVFDGTTKEEQASFHSALSWYKSGMESVFLQDANTMIIKPDDLVDILTYLKHLFPQIQRITSYARSHTIARISDANMARFTSAGLNRIHIGMESASDEVLRFVKKGVDKKTHIKAGQRVKRAGIQLSEYFMPGLGGSEYSMANAIETADAIISPIKKFLAMDPERQMIYRVGRRTGVFLQLADLERPDLLAHAEAARDRYGVTEDNVDTFTETIIKQFI